MKSPVDLGEEPIKSLFFKYYIPTLASLLSVTVHQIINGIILGQYVGKEGVAAVGLFGPILTVFIALALALMIGGGILISKNIGSKNFYHAQEIFQFTTTIAIILGCLTALSSPFITGPITNFLVGSENQEMIRSTYDYMFWGFIWLPFFFIRMLWSNFVSSDSSPKVSRNSSLLAVALNVVLDFILIIIFPFGTAGASIATGLSILGAVVYLFIHISQEKGNLSIERFKFTFKLKGWKELFRFGIPSFVSEISFSFGLLILNKSLVPFGTLAISAFGIINHLSFIFIRLLTAAMISALPIMSFNIGTGSFQRVLETFKFSMIFTFIIGLIVSVIGFLIPDFLVSIFSGQESESFKNIAINAIGLYFILFVAAGPNFILGAYLQSIGKSAMSTVITILKGLALISFFIFVLSEYFGMGLNGIWLSRSFAEIVTLILIGSLTFFNRQNYYSREAVLKQSAK
jgi:putative MATE family efflux protein